ncbi:MAG: efflux RND transporter permease subunit, partial [Bacteroidota bacterium]
MKITDLSIKYRTSVVVLTIVLVVGGLLSYITIPKEAAPSIEIPLIVVTTIYGGVSPDDIESLVTQPIEREVQSVNGIKEIRSTSTEGVSTVIVEFNPEVSIDDAYQKVRDKVDIAKPEMPDEIEEPIISEIDFSEFPILTINLAAGYSLTRLKDVGEDLADELEKIPTVLEVTVLGGLEREVQVNVDLAALQGYNLSFDDVIGAIQTENTTIPGGSIDVDRLNYLVRASGEFEDPAALNNLVVKTPEGGAPIYVRDVADVVFGYKDRSSYARLTVFQREDDEGSLLEVAAPEEGQVVSLNVKMRSGENILETVDAINTELANFTLPRGTQVEITGDQSEDVRTLVSDLENNIISGLIFVILVLLFFLGVRNATLVGLAIPMSMFISFILFQVLGYTLNFIILFSLIIALGMLVDNAIVIVENIYRFKEEGYDRWEAARLATNEVGSAVVASTATTVAAFAPMLFWPGIIGEFMSYMPLTLIVTLTSSLFVALIINPVITGYFVRVEGEEGEKRGRLARNLGYGTVGVIAVVIGLANPITLGVLGVAAVVLYFLHTRVMKPLGDRFMDNGLPRMVRAYRGFLSWMLERDYSSVRRPFLRNTLSLSLFTIGFVLCAAGGIVSSLLGQASGSVLLFPGGVMLGLGLIGILLHTFEAMLLGRMKTVIAGVALGATAGLLLFALSFGDRPLDLEIIIELLILPALLIIFGFIGKAVLGNRERLILTDNRARLMNSTLGTLFFIAFLFAIAPTGVVFFPETDPSRIIVKVEASLGTNLDTSNDIAAEAKRRIDGLMAQDPMVAANIKNVQVGVGVGGDIMFGGGAARPENSEIGINMVDYSDRVEPSMNTLRKIRNELSGLPGALIEIDVMQEGPPTGAPVNIEITGEEFTEIVRITN